MAAVTEEVGARVAFSFSPAPMAKMHAVIKICDMPDDMLNSAPPPAAHTSKPRPQP